MNRSSRPEVRNPVLGLPACRKLLAQPQDVRQSLAKVYYDLCRDCQERADKAWAQGKAPMAAYWKAQSVYARHFGRALRRPDKEKA